MARNHLHDATRRRIAIMPRPKRRNDMRGLGDGTARNATEQHGMTRYGKHPEKRLRITEEKKQKTFKSWARSTFQPWPGSGRR
jgi:LmbE family N-acetylglucosaminyl deacetylase